MQAKGYSVRATVRSKSDEDKVGHLLRLAAALPGGCGWLAGRVAGLDCCWWVVVQLSGALPRPFVIC
jgi:hypothetical protein